MESVASMVELSGLVELSVVELSSSDCNGKLKDRTGAVKVF